ncbi:MAG: Uma2 family endonuclease [Bacteroidota bacterium]
MIVNKYAEGATLAEVRLRWTRDMYERLAANGGFDGLRVELIHGHILDKVSPQGSPHSTAVTLALSALQDVFQGGAHVRVQLPLRALNDSEPEPDLAVVPGSPREYAREHPSAALLVVEVAASSLDTDRTQKLAVYAESGVPDYWIVNLRDRVLEVHRDPQGSTYLSRRVLDGDESIAPLTRSDVPVAVADLLP